MNDLLKRIGLICFLVFSLLLALPLTGYATQSSANTQLLRLPADKICTFDFVCFDAQGNIGTQPVYRSNGKIDIKWRYNVAFADMQVNEHTIFLMDSYGVLRLIDFSGDIKSVQAYKAATIPSLTKGLDGTVYMVDEGLDSSAGFQPGTVRAFSADGDMKWETQINNKPCFETSNFCGGDGQGNFYLISRDGIHAYDNKGNIKWTNTDVLEIYDDFDFSHNLYSFDVDREGNIYVNTTNRGIVCIDPTGNVKWERELEILSYSFFKSGNPLIYRNEEKIMSLAPDTGELIGEKNVSEKKQDFMTQGDWPEGYYFDLFGKINSFNRQGNLNWSYQMPFSAYQRVWRQPIADVNGNVFFHDGGGNLYCLDHNGNEQLILLQNDPNTNYSKLFATQDGKIFFASSTLGLISLQPHRIEVSVNDVQVDFPAPPQMIGGKLMVPFRQIFETLGMRIKWDPATQTVTGTKDNLSISLQIGSKIAEVDGAKRTLDVPPANINGTTYVPLRFIGEASGLNVAWDQQTKSVEIGTDQQQILSTIRNKIRYLNMMDVEGQAAIMESRPDAANISDMEQLYHSASVYAVYDEIQIVSQKENEAWVQVPCKLGVVNWEEQIESDIVLGFNLVKNSSGVWKFRQITAQ